MIKISCLWVTILRRALEWPAKGFVPQISNIQPMSLQHTQWQKNNIIDCIEILAQKQIIGGMAVTRLANSISVATGQTLVPPKEASNP